MFFTIVCSISPYYTLVSVGIYSELIFLVVYTCTCEVFDEYVGLSSTVLGCPNYSHRTCIQDL